MMSTVGLRISAFAAISCREAGVECRSSTFLGDDDRLLDFIIDLNLHRRHLDEGQRAMAAARIASLQVGRPSEKSAN